MRLERTRLTDEEVARFHRDGYIIAPFQFSPEEAALLSEGVTRSVEINADKRNEPIVNAHRRNIDKNGHEFSLMEFCRKEEVLDMIESIDGPNLMLWTTTVFERPARDGVATPWHQDGEFWPITPMAGTSAWVAATPVTKENGCVRVIPGSHLRPVRHIEVAESLFVRQTDPEQFNEADAVDIELQPGQMMLFDSRLIHGSWPNTSENKRQGFVMRYIPTTSHFDHEGNAQFSPDGKTPPYADRALFLMRGGDKCGKNDFHRNH